MNWFGFVAAEDIDIARSPHWLWPEPAELIYGTLSSLLVFALLFKFAGPPIKKAMNARTERIQGELDAAAEAKTTAEAEAAGIRAAAGDIDAERQRLFAQADTLAEQLLADGRARLEAEVDELRARGEADLAAAGGRVNDEVRGEILRLANRATEAALADGIVDDATQQELIENFIQKVGQS